MSSLKEWISSSKSGGKPSHVNSPAEKTLLPLLLSFAWCHDHEQIYNTELSTKTILKVQFLLAEERCLEHRRLVSQQKSARVVCVVPSMRSEQQVGRSTSTFIELFHKGCMMAKAYIWRRRLFAIFRRLYTVTFLSTRRGYPLSWRRCRGVQEGRF